MKTNPSRTLLLLVILGLACGGKEASTSEASPPNETRCQDVLLASPLQLHGVRGDSPPAIERTEPPPPPGTYGLAEVTDYVGASGTAGYLGMTVRIDREGAWHEVVVMGDGEPSAHLHEVVTRRTFVLVPSRLGDEYESVVRCGAEGSAATMRFRRRSDGRWFVVTQIGEFPRTLVLQAE